MGICRVWLLAIALDPGNRTFLTGYDGETILTNVVGKIILST